MKQALDFDTFARTVGATALASIEEDGDWSWPSVYFSAEGRTIQDLSFAASRMRTIELRDVETLNALFPMRGEHILAEGMHHNFELQLDRFLRIEQEYRRSSGRIVEIPDDRPYMLVGLNSSNFWHFIYNFFLRLSILERIDPALASELHFAVADPIFADLANLFPMIGIGLNRLCRIPAAGIARFERLVVVEAPYYIGGGRVRASREAARLFDPLLPATRPRRRVYISRRDARWRKTVNEDAVAARLGQLGFETIELAGHPIEAIAATLGETAVLVGSSGANLAAASFMQPGASVVELGYRRIIRKYYFHGTSGMKRLHHFKVECPLAGPEDRHERQDFEVPLDLLEAAVDEALAMAAGVPA